MKLTTAFAAASLTAIALTACQPETPIAAQQNAQAENSAAVAADHLGAAGDAVKEGAEAAAVNTAEAAGEVAATAKAAGQDAAAVIDASTQPVQEAYRQGKTQQAAEYGKAP